jgi:flavin-binding protein dodecin
MVDYSINGQKDLHFTEYDKFVTVDGREEFQQNVVIALQAAQADLIGQTSDDTITEKIQLAVSRVAKAMDNLDSIRQVNVSKPGDTVLGKRQPAGKITVEIVYTSGAVFQETV